MSSPMRSSRPVAALRWAFIIVALMCSVGPVLYGVLLSLRPYSAVLLDPLDVVPGLSEIDLSSYTTAMKDPSAGGFGLGRFVINSLLVAVAAVVLSIIGCVFGAYAVARLRYRGRRFTSAIILAVYLFPGIVIAVPEFVILSRMGLTGSLYGLLIIYVAATIPVALYMMRNYFLALPESVEEAALLDGCSLPTMLRKVVLPIALPGVMATAIYVFMIAWNEYFYALLFLVQDRSLWTAPLGLAQLTDQQVPVTVLLAGSIAVTAPVIAIFFLAQRYIVAGLTSGADR
ncbi:carbohydrate ABC transporter permease [Dactylosporangium maewongense]|uniref:Carbohydrate ABC transporter permease n=1 Tax=Dactylosporangium maewongense TaxID=634393 RepID=A0ABP4NXX3_9ACTN